MRKQKFSKTYAAVLRIPSVDNDCDAHTLLAGSADAGFFCANKKISSLPPEGLLNKVQEYYSYDPEALHRFYCFLLLKAQEILQNKNSQ